MNMIKFSRLGAAFGLMIATSATATSATADTGAGQVVVEYAYQPDQVYSVRTGLGITTQIELSPEEVVLDYSTGFSGGWDLSRRGNVFYLKPKNVDVDTNLMVRTAAHAYIFELKVVATDWRHLDQARMAGVQYKVRFSYPQETSFAAASAPVDEAKQLSSVPAQGRTYHFDYEYSRHRSQPAWMVPAAVYDDRQFTYIRMETLDRFPSGNFPVVFAKEHREAEDHVVNTTIEGDMIVVHGTYPYLVLRHGRHVVGLRRKTPR